MVQISKNFNAKAIKIGREQKQGKSSDEIPWQQLWQYMLRKRKTP